MVRKRKTDAQKVLIREANRLNYRLRSAFFYQKLVQYGTIRMPDVLKQLLPIAKTYDWSKHSEWGISGTSFERISKSDVPLIQVFVHPKLLREQPILLSYYRNVAALSQKSVSYLISLHPGKYEDKPPKSLPEAEAVAYSNLFNEHISIIIDNAVQGFDERHLLGLLFASTGAQIDGSWRNEVGVQAEKFVQRLLLTEAARRKLVSAVLPRDGEGVIVFDGAKTSKQLEKSADFKGFVLKNKGSVLYSSEPDVSFLDAGGHTTAVMEVKGGSDPAGALERYGAVKKSLEESKKVNKKVKTILLMSCITPEVGKRIKTDKAINRCFDLAHILTNEKEKMAFLDYVFSELIKK